MNINKHSLFLTIARTGKNNTKYITAKWYQVYLLAQYTHSLVFDEEVDNGGTAIVLPDQVDLKSISLLDHDS